MPPKRHSKKIFGPETAKAAIPGRAPIGLTDNVSITAKHRHRCGLVPIICIDKRARSVMMPSSKPEALAKASLAEKGHQP